MIGQLLYIGQSRFRYVVDVDEREVILPLRNVDAKRLSAFAGKTRGNLNCMQPVRIANHERAALLIEPLVLRPKWAHLAPELHNDNRHRGHR